MVHLNKMLKLESKEKRDTYTMTAKKKTKNGDNLNVVINANI